MDFTTTGEKLASVGQAPDFMLTVWDWVNEKVILHCKAFGQDVAKVSECRSKVDMKTALRCVASRTHRVVRGHMATHKYRSKVFRESWGGMYLPRVKAQIWYRHGAATHLARHVLWEAALELPTSAETDTNEIVRPPFSRCRFPRTTKVA